MIIKKKFSVNGFSVIALGILFAFIFSSCKTTAVKTQEVSPKPFYPNENWETSFSEDCFQDGSRIKKSENIFEGKDTILLTFAGDLMAHKNVWKNGQFERIYESIVPVLKNSDFAFTNLETPVCDSRPYSSYPAFNVHHEYVDTAVDSGFNVFSLTNNHTNDMGLTGINSTKEYFKTKSRETAGSQRPVYYAGLKNSKNGPLTYQVLETKKGFTDFEQDFNDPEKKVSENKDDEWKILFVAITELMNNESNSQYVDFVPPQKSERDRFIRQIKKLREENPVDLFVVSIHCCDPEYIFDIRKNQKSWYLQLLENGVDVIWVNHPHVAKNWELIPDENNVPRKIIFYSMGNLISSHESRRNTGEGFMTQVRFEKSFDGEIRIIQINPILLTTFVTEDDHHVIKKLNDEFITELENSKSSQVNFFRERLKFMKKISGEVKWQ